ncbi:hypothetical protein R1flu_025597 [Riccia fluitans]|uniref:Ubiquitin-like protease family profile domain-containing protein n=1 Tax=Riccia fluitans TaxID=41844 RepID=A0ABD1XY72_9MARC
MDHVEDIQSPSPDVTSKPTEATQGSSTHNSEGLEIVPYMPRKVQTTVVAVEVPSSPESPRDGMHTMQEFDDWKSYDDLTKEDIDFVLKPRGYVRGDVMNMYIKAKFLGLPRGALYGKIFVNTFWFLRVKTLTDKFRNDFNNERVRGSIHRMRSSISPRVDDVQHINSLIIPIHFGNSDYHWSLAVIHLGKKWCTIYHLDSFWGTHNSPVVTQALSIFTAIALNRSPEDIYVGEYYTRGKLRTTNADIM